MNRSGPIIIVDDDSDDLELFELALKSLGVKNRVILFSEGKSFIEFLRKKNELVFFILCDINMPQMDGFQLREQISGDSQLASISIPFIFFSTSGDINQITRAYKSPIQGYFMKPSNFEDIKKMFASIISYWDSCTHPVATLS